MTSKAVEQLSSPGGPFEFTSTTINGMNCRVFKNTPPCLTSIYTNLEQFADRDLAVFDGRRLTYKQAGSRAANLAQYLVDEYAIAKDDRVAIVMRNTPEWLIAFIAVTSLGAIPALVNSRGAANEIAYCVSSTGCKLVISDVRTEQGLDDTDIANVPRLSFELEQDFTLAGQAQQLKATEDTSLPLTKSDPEDVALILFTSGTTGRPKAALLTHRGVMTALRTNEYSSALIGIQMAEKYGLDLATLAANRPQPCTLLMFPLFHVSGCQAIFLSNFVQGGKVVMMPRWDSDKALALIEQEKITSFPGVPAMYWDLLRAPTREDYDLTSISNISVSGQATPMTLFNAIKDAFPNAVMGCGYGMTETNGTISLIIGEDLLNNPTSVGRTVATMEIKLMADEKTEAAQGERGEIYIRGATVMLGYDDNPEANAKSLIDGWYRSGDIGMLDENDQLYIVDRATEMIISSGENIYCAEVERVLNQAVGVLESVTFGIPDDRLGEKLIALISKQPESSLSIEELLDFAKTKLASYKVPGETYFIDEVLPRTPTGKVLKDGAREIYKRLIG